MTTTEATISVLIADDHPLVRKGLRQVLEDDPAIGEITEAGDGEEALRVIRARKPTVAILDLDMPVKSGLAVLRELSLENCPTLLIVLTIYREEDMFNEAMDFGVRGYILKDSAVSDILNAVKHVAAGEYYISPIISRLLIQRGDRIKSFRRTYPQIETLTAAERNVLKLVAQNRTSKEIAELLHVSPKTIENHRVNIAKKLGLHGTHSLVKFAFENKSSID